MSPAMIPPAVSVVMPVYKPEFLTTAIESVLAQTMRDFELILINDGSPHKHTDEIAAAFAAEDSRIRYLRQNNMGLAGARNAGVAAARTPYIMFMDDDDVSAPERMERQLRFLELHPQVASVGCQHLLIDKHGCINKKVRGDIPAPQLPGTVIQQPPPPLHSNPTMALGPHQMVRKAAYDEIGGMRGYFRIFEDSDFFYRLEEKFAVAMMAQPLYYYRANYSPHQLTRKRDADLYVYAAKYSAHCRRNGKPDIIDDSPPFESVLTHAAAAGLIPQKAVWKAAKKLLLQKRFVFLRDFIAAHETRGGGDLKLRLKLAYWSLVNNRLGFWVFYRGAK